MREAYFTICSANYLAYARTLHASLRRAGIDAPFYLFLVDEVAGRFNVKGLDFPCIESRELGIANHFDMAARYTVMEMNTAVKPFCIEWLFDHADAEAAVYLDPDLYILRPLDHVIALLEGGANAVLTPHSTAPLDDGGDPDDIRIMQTGAYNLGFGAFRRSADTRDFLGWWGRNLEARCVVDLKGGLFVDQKFMDLAPSYLSFTAILRHPGYNTAYWNLIHRPVAHDLVSDEWFAAGELLYFFHFSGVVPGNRTVFSKHQNRFDTGNIGALHGLLDTYLSELESNAVIDGIRLNGLPYHYNCLSNGLAFTDDMRHVYADAQRPQPRVYDECFGPDLNLYCTLAPQVQQDQGAPVTRLLQTIWSRRSDVQQIYPLSTAEGRLGLAKWFLSSGAREHNVPGPILVAFRRNMAAPASRPLPDFVTRPSGLDIYGYFRTESGVGTGARGNWRAARAAGVSCDAFLLTTGVFQNKADVGIPLGTGPSRHDCVLLHINADQVLHIETMIEPERLRGRYRIGYWAWELSRFPKEWDGAYDKVDEIWAPSSFAARAFAQRTRKPVYVVPHPVPIPPPLEDMNVLRRRFEIPEDRMVFLTAFDFNSFLSRKNPMAVVKAFQSAFPERGPSSPVLVIKCHGSPARDSLHREFFAALSADSRIKLIDKVLSSEDILSLQSCCDSFVSLHRSEGFGLWVAECMALGKPVVTTNYGGTADFAFPDNSFPIGFSMTPVETGSYPFGAGQWWADPNHDEAVSALVTIADSETTRRDVGDAARTHISNQLSDFHVGTIIASRLSNARGHVLTRAA